jgi:hypothetical protein
VKLLKGKRTSQLVVSSSSSSDAEGLGLSSKKGRMGSSKSEEEIQFQFHEGTQVIDEEPASKEKEPVSAKDIAKAEQEPARIQRLLAMNLKGSDQMFYKRKRGSQPQGRFLVSDEQSAAPSLESTPKDKGKKIMFEDEPEPKKLKKKEQVELAVDDRLSKELHEEEVMGAEEESRILQEKFDAQLQYIISIDLIVRGEAYTLVCNESLSSDEMTIKLNDFITKKYNQEALDDVCNNSHFQINFYCRKISLFLLFIFPKFDFYFIFSYDKSFPWQNKSLTLIRSFSRKLLRKYTF